MSGWRSISSSLFFSFGAILKCILPTYAQTYLYTHTSTIACVGGHGCFIFSPNTGSKPNNYIAVPSLAVLFLFLVTSFPNTSSSFFSTSVLLSPTPPPPTYSLSSVLRRLVGMLHLPCTVLLLLIVACAPYKYIFIYLLWTKCNVKAL